MTNSDNYPIYLDSHATTQVDQRVLDKMLPYFTEIYGNAASIDHLHGYEAKKAVDQARSEIAKLIGGKKGSEIIFTSGATESNNLALIGAYNKYKSKGNHIITSAIEHPSVLDTVDYLKTQGAEVSIIPVDKDGIIDIERLKKEIRKDTIIVSIMYANNEIGTIQPIEEIGEITKPKGILFHCDAVQAAGYLEINVYKMNIDLLSLSGHKIYGPKGIGVLFVRSENPYVRLDPIIHGGGHERGMRSGTLNVPGIVGIAEALKISEQNRKKNFDKMLKLRNDLFNQLKKKNSDIKLNGHSTKRIPNNLNITIPGVESKALIHSIKDKLSISAGSACTTLKTKPSHVLKAIGLSDEETYHTVRIGLAINNSNISEIMKLNLFIES